jgi:heme exporter protein D
VTVIGGVFFAWATGVFGAVCVLVYWIGQHITRAVRWIRDLDRQLATEARIRAAELQSEDDLAAIQAINALDAHDPRRTP